MAAILVPSFADFGKAARDVLYGSTARQEGVFQFDHAVSATSTTADGVTIMVNAIRTAAPGVSMSLTGVAMPHKNVVVTGTLKDTGSMIGSFVLSNALGAPGLKLSGSAAIPDVMSAGGPTISADYLIGDAARVTAAIQGFGSKSSPRADIGATFALKDRGSTVLGVEVGGLVAQPALDKWSIAASRFLTNSANQSTVSLSGGPSLMQPCTLLATSAWALNESTLLAAEYSQQLVLGAVRPARSSDVPGAPGSESSVATYKPEVTASAPILGLGFLRRLQSGAIAKGKIDSSGTLSVLYEQRLLPDVKMTMSSQLDVLNLRDRAPRVGISLDLSNA